MKKSRVFGISMIFFLAFIVCEVGVRVSGLTELPLYDANSEIGYIPKENQSGFFLHQRRWRFNEYSMGAGSFKPAADRFNILLIGDSIVLGGNPLNEEDRLGPRLEFISGWQVWPISAGSWALQNELTYLRNHPGVVDKVDAIAFVLNSGDFGEPSSWASELTHPRSEPTLHSLYVFKKYVLKMEYAVEPGMRVPMRNWQKDFKEFIDSVQKPIFVFMYPTQEELGNSILRAQALDAFIPKLGILPRNRLVVGKVADSSEWRQGLYRDSIHPGANGNATLAEIFRSTICKNELPKTSCRGS